MQLSPFGGGIIEQIPILLKMIFSEIREINPSQVLLIPFAREVYEPDSPWHEKWFQEYVGSFKSNVEFLDARNDSDRKKANVPMIYLSGGSTKQNLINTINSSSELQNLINNAKYIIAESSGAMVLGDYSRSFGEDSEIIKGLGILKDTIIEPHYFEKSRKSLLLNKIRTYNCSIGIGIDSNSGIRINTETGTDVLTPLGNGKYEIIMN